MDSAGRCYIRKSAIAVVMVKDALLVAGDEDVLVSVAVIIPNRHTHCEKVGRDSGLLRDVRESAVAIVAVEGVMVRSLRVVDRRFPGVHEQQVHVAVIVVIKDGHTGRLSLGQEVLLRLCVVMDPRDAGLLW